MVDHTVIYPHPPQSRRSEAKNVLKDLVGKHQIGVVAIGNGTACRETEELIAEIIAEGTQFSSPDYVPPEPAQEAAAQVLPEPGPPASPAGHGEPVGLPEAAAMATPAEPEPVESVSHQHEPPGPLAAEPPHDESPREHGLSSENNSAHGRENSLEPIVGGTSVNESDSVAENHHAGAAEAVIEVLPPISGGSPEAEVELSHVAPASSEDNSPTVAPSTAEGEREGPDSASPLACETAAEGTEYIEARHEEIAAEHAIPGVPEPSTEVKPPESAAAVAPAPTEPSAESAAPAAPARTEKTKPPSSRPPRPGKQGGQGKSDSSRSRSSRQRHGPPPPVEPPRPHPADPQLAQLAYVVVNEAGASVYSTSQVGRDELPDLDATLRSGISIGRRLLDPLAELVKIEPQSIGVGLYQHDVHHKHLKETLESVIASCVNFVGVDLNTASVTLLRHVSGLNQLTARRIADYRKEHGSFANREQLTQVEGVGPATFTQAAGFLKIPDGENPLDRTWIHPESYPAAIKFLEKLGFAPDVVRDKARLPELNEKLATADLGELSRELEVGELTLRDIIDALARPERDPREDLPKPIFKKGILKIEDLSPGLELKGTVLNVVDFGAFVDIGLKDAGLVHISQLANRYVKSPHDVVSVGDVVTVWVMGVDHERKRVSLTMVKPGTERHRGQQHGGVLDVVRAERANLERGIVAIAVRAKGSEAAVAPRDRERGRLDPRPRH